MTIEEYINRNLPFFHITKMENVDEILRIGLLLSKESGARHGICVVRSEADDIISEIIDCQLQVDGLEHVVPDGVLTICDGAFGFCEDYVVLSVPRSIKVIGDYIFGQGGGKIVIRD